jgi:hypothetical protein
MPPPTIASMVQNTCITGMMVHAGNISSACEANHHPEPPLSQFTSG